MFNKGDKVTVLDDAMDGTVTATNGDQITVLTTDGFELNFSSKELLKISGDELKMGFASQNISQILKDKEEIDDIALSLVREFNQEIISLCETRKVETNVGMAGVILELNQK